MDLNPEPILVKSATAARLASQLAAVQLVPPLDGVATALPGSTARGSAATLADSWVQRVRGLAGDIDRHAEALRTAVQTLGQVDDDHRRDLQRHSLCIARPWGVTGFGPLPRVTR